MAKKQDQITLSFPNPLEALVETVDSISKNAVTLFDEVFSSSRQERMRMGKFTSKISMPKFNFNKKTGLQIVVPVLVVAILAFVAVGVIKKATGPQVAGVSTSSAKDVKTVEINREFKFPLTDDNGKQAGKFTYIVKSAELRHQLVLKGQSATAVPGRVFLIVNLQLVNSMDQGLNINTRDYIRISLNEDDKQLFAPDIHNDPVEAQAISTTNTRVGIAINESDHDIQLHVGEIEGKKTVIPLSFK